MFRKRTIAHMLVVLAGLSVAGFAFADKDKEPVVTAELLLSTSETVLGQPFAYATGAAPKVTAVIATIPPGAKTGLHHHDVPLFGYMLEGELTVTYEGVGEHVYRAGDSLIEAIKTPHEGRNTGSGPVRILAVFMGAEGIPNTVEEK